MSTLNAVKPLKFIDITPGSQIVVEDSEHAEPPYNALVIQMRPEYGPNALPALFVRKEGESEMSLVLGTGRWKVRRIAAGEIIAATEPSENIRRFKSRPVEIEAIQFVGGLESATEIIQFAAGKAVISYHAPSAESGEHLTIHTNAGQLRVDPGTWVAEGAPNDVYPIPGDVLERKYEQLDG